MKRLPLLLCAFSIALATGCPQTAVDENNGANNATNNGSNNGSNNGGDCTDSDGDGFSGKSPQCPDGPDCNDNDASVNPTASEVCQDRKDNDCDGDFDSADSDCGNAMDCVDGDGDRYGEGDTCFGPDCDDSDANINPDAQEICGNGVDENCDPSDDECPENCVDDDMDGFGTMAGPECGDEMNRIDCDDANADINPDATEVCDGDDNDCDDDVDECPLAGQACAGDMCQGGAGAECENHDNCAGQFLKCDTSSDPKVCKSAEGGQCADVDDCLNGLACDDDTCTGDFCAVNDCNDPAYPHCDSNGAQCVECPYFDGFSTADAECSDGDVCTEGGWCAEPLPLDSEDPFPNTATTDDVFWVSIAMAYCWLDVRPDGDKKMCTVFEITSDITRAITEDMVESAYVDGDMDQELFPDENDALNDIWGEGLFNRKEIDWKADLQPGTDREFCLWYQPGGFFGGETLVMDKCGNFTP